MDAILGKYGCPPKLWSTITRMYKDSEVILIIGKLDTSIPFKVGVKQGDIMAPILFLFIIMDFSETVEKEWIKQNLHKIQFCRHDNSPISSDIISSHPRRSFSEGNLFEIFYLLYIDDGEFDFSSRRELEIGSDTIQPQFSKFGLQMHVDSISKPSKTEDVYPPPPSFFQTTSSASPFQHSRPLTPTHCETQTVKWDHQNKTRGSTIRSITWNPTNQSTWNRYTHLLQKIQISGQLHLLLSVWLQQHRKQTSTSIVIDGCSSTLLVVPCGRHT